MLLSFVEANIVVHLSGQSSSLLVCVFERFQRHESPALNVLNPGPRKSSKSVLEKRAFTF